MNSSNFCQRKVHHEKNIFPSTFTFSSRTKVPDERLGYKLLLLCYTLHLRAADVSDTYFDVLYSYVKEEISKTLIKIGQILCIQSSTC